MKRIRKGLILRGGALGDFLLTLPVVAALHRQWPASPIDLAIDSRFAELALATGWVRHVLPLESARMAQLYVRPEARDPDLVEHLRGYDAAICFLDDADRTIAPALEDAGIRRRVFCSPHVKSGHAVDHFLSVLPEIDVKPEFGGYCVLDLDPAVQPSPEVRRIFEPGPFAVIHPGSGSPRKNWPLDRFLRLAERIQKHRRLRPVFLLGEAEAGWEPAVRKALPSVTCLVNQRLLDVAGILRRAHLYIGNDSGITHLAALTGAPTWALFGPTDPAQWAPRGPRTHVVRSPGGQGRATMAQLSEEAVWQALPE